MQVMTKDTQKLLKEIEAFLQTSGMGASYFGKKATGNSELVARLRENGRVWPETAAKVRSFIKRHETSHVRNSGRVISEGRRQGRGTAKRGEAA